MFWQDYVRVESVDEALDNLDCLRGDGRIIAGGTDLILQLRAGQKKTRCLMDISSVNSLRGITHKNEKIIIYIFETYPEKISPDE